MAVVQNRKKQQKESKNVDPAVSALQFVKNNPKEVVKAAARIDLLCYARYMKPNLDIQPFHKVYYKILNKFAHGEIKRLIVTMPPQHGKSEGSSRIMPSFVLGNNPDKKIAIGSYSTGFARDFNRDVQKIIDTEEYRELFPETFLSRSKKNSGSSVYQRNSDVIECVGHTGGLRVVGRGGPLTGKSVDIMILDDVYKDYKEANSPVVREAAWNWYTTVVETRMHNNSQRLIVFTRWHSDDIIGKLEKEEKIIEVKDEKDLHNIPEGAWVKINFEAIKTTDKSELDPREVGDVLWPGRHNLASLLAKRKLDKVQFDCLYQGFPGTSVGLLYSINKTYIRWQDWGTLISKGNYTDCADEGTDYLCSINYNLVLSNEAKDEKGNPVKWIMVTDVIYTDEPIEVTTESVPMMLNREVTQYANVESNNGGKAFSKIIQKKTRTDINWFTQTGNKESRIVTNAGLVSYHVVMPFDWETRFPLFYKHVTNFLRNFKANAHDDAADALTGIIEKEILINDEGIELKN
jgi:predicted phage terminase large subunit-like protein